MIFGQLLALRLDQNNQPLMMMLAAPGTERHLAREIGFRAVFAPDWTGTKQVLFLHDDSSQLELWDKELREGFE